MKIMSIDYGDARTGVAFCDVREMLATAYTVIHEAYQPKLVKQLVEIMNKEKAEMVVIGLPRNMDGSYGFRAEKCRELGELLKSEIDIPYLMRKNKEIIEKKLQFMERFFDEYSTLESLQNGLCSLREETYSNNLIITPVIWGMMERWIK